MKYLILVLFIFLSFSTSVKSQFIVVYPQVRHYNNYNYNNYGYNYNNYNNYNYGYRYNNYYYNNNWNRYVTPSGYMPFNNPYFQMATQGIGRGW